MPTIRPTVAEVNANEAISGSVLAKASPIAAAVPEPPTQPANSTVPSASGEPNSGCNKTNTKPIPSATCSAYIKTPWAAKPPTLRLILRISKSSVIATAANTMAINTDEYVDNWSDSGSHPNTSGPSTSPSTPAITEAGIINVWIGLMTARRPAPMISNRPISPASISIVHGVNSILTSYSMDCTTRNEDFNLVNTYYHSRQTPRVLGR